MFHRIENDQMVAWSKSTPDGSDVVLGFVSLDGHHRQSGWTDLDLGALGLTDDRPFTVRDLLTDARYTWHGARNFVELDPSTVPGHLFEIVTEH